MDFEQLEAFIQNNAAVVQSPTSATTQTSSGDTPNQNTNPNNLPESPPDSGAGSEPPYSPNVKGNQSLQMDHMTQGSLNMNTLTELRVPHHHNLLTPSTELYLANEHQHQQQQLLQINNLMHNKLDGPLLPTHHHQTQQDHMLLYQVNQSGQIIELNHIHHQNQPMSSRMYKGDMVELENPGPLPAIHDIQSSLQNTLNDNLSLMGESFSPLSNHAITNNGTGSVKKRKGTSQAFIPDGDGNLKAFIKSESSEFVD